MRCSAAKSSARAFSAKASDPIESRDIYVTFAFNYSVISAANQKLCQTCGRFLPRTEFTPRNPGSRTRYPSCRVCEGLRIKSGRPGETGRRSRVALNLVKAQRIDRFYRELARLRSEVLTPDEQATYLEGIGQVRRRFSDSRERLETWKDEAEVFGLEVPRPKQRRRPSRSRRRR